MLTNIFLGIIFGFLSVFLGSILFLIYIGVRTYVLLKRTDKVIKKYFSVEDIWTEKVYKRPLLVTAGEKVFVLKPLKFWQIHKMVQLLLLNKDDFNLDDLIKQDSFYPSLAYLFLERNEDIVSMINYLKNNIMYSQIFRILQVIILQNNLKYFVKVYKELKNG